MLKISPQKILFLLMMFFIFSITLMTAVAQERLSGRSKVTIDGIGAIRVGMTPKQATQAGGVPLITSGYASGECVYYQPKGQLKGLGFMTIEGAIARVDITQNSQITTRSGAKIGDTEAKIQSLYPDRIKVTPHKYNEKGHYLTYVPKDTTDKNYRLIFETDGNKVTQYRSGRLPEVEWVEGCS